MDRSTVTEGTINTAQKTQVYEFKMMSLTERTNDKIIGEMSNPEYA